MSALAHIRVRRLRHQILDNRNFYEREWLVDEVKQWQLEQFNREWESIRRDVPYFQRLCQRKGLPSQFGSWQEFMETVPITNRRTIQDNRAIIASRIRRPDFWRTTGGSTAEPVQIPAWKSELDFAAKDMWYARNWFGVSPSDKLFLLWGHSHLLGRGLKGWFNGAKRRLKDALLGYYRHSAYDLSRQSLRKAAEILLSFRPAYILGYAVALDRFARFNQDLRAAFHKVRLKIAVATAESFPTSESAELVADVLGCPVVMEYGAVETGPLAHQRPDGYYSVFWRHYFVESCESTDVPGAYEILITSLYPRCFPLIRYRLGDLISINPNEEHSVQEFKTVIGRCNDYVVLPNGGVIHSEAFTHAIKDLAAISAYQVVQSAEGDIALKCVAATSIGSHETAEIRRRLDRINTGLAEIRLEWVESLDQTIAGKTRRVIRN